MRELTYFRRWSDAAEFSNVGNASFSEERASAFAKPLLPELCDQRSAFPWRIEIEKLMQPAGLASMGLRGRLFPGTHVELFAHEFRFVSGTATQHVSEMFDAVLAGIGGL